MNREQIHATEHLKAEIRRLRAQERYTFADLVTVVQLLRSPEGCPWDREQTHRSIRSCLIEETYEVVEAIDTENATLLREELGDLLFQVVFHSQIRDEEGSFTMDDVINDICVKMIHRHPHVFGTAEMENSEEVLKNWENIKTEEKQRRTLADKLRAVPPMLPALMRASKVARKTGDAEASHKRELQQRAARQMEVLQGSLASDSCTKEALGDLLYSLSALAGACEIDAEEALSATTDRRIAAEIAKETLL